LQLGQGAAEKRPKHMFAEGTKLYCFGRGV